MSITYIEAISELQQRGIAALKVAQSTQLASLKATRSLTSALVAPRTGLLAVNPILRAVTEWSTTFTFHLLEQQISFVKELTDTLAKPVKKGTGAVLAATASGEAAAPVTTSAEDSTVASAAIDDTAKLATTAADNASAFATTASDDASAFATTAADDASVFVPTVADGASAFVGTVADDASALGTTVADDAAALVATTGHDASAIVATGADDASALVSNFSGDAPRAAIEGDDVLEGVSNRTDGVTALALTIADDSSELPVPDVPSALVSPLPEAAINAVESPAAPAVPIVKGGFETTPTQTPTQKAKQRKNPAVSNNRAAPKRRSRNK